MKLRELTDFLEENYPLALQESYDNSGLIIGDKNIEITGAIVCLDSIESVVDEAIQKKCNLIIAHHPIIFKGLKKLTNSNYIERVVTKCIKNDIALYAIHTNLDNHFEGVNKEIANRIGLKNVRILQPIQGNLSKLTVFAPKDALVNLDEAIFKAGGGQIGNYSECHFRTEGVGTFKGNENSNPQIGTQNMRESVEEFRVEYLVSNYNLRTVLNAMYAAHPYEEVAYEIYPIQNSNQFEGAAMIGELENELDEIEFLTQLKKTFNCGAIRHTQLFGKKIKKVAICGGSGSFLLSKALQQKADIFITGDFKYHEFFDAENKIIIADIGHYESEQFTSNLLAEKIKENFTNFAIHLTEHNTNP
ncbi:MAG: Nif3-like dinuclear metal center hexameric protein, partial [Crocinitomicaceae bacterium]|nr:Nif3-like dinuclear metal center hexameric protein [Crocinitomicaceae bacterium]